VSGYENTVSGYDNIAPALTNLSDGLEAFSANKHEDESSSCEVQEKAIPIGALLESLPTSL
jgi:hypothetical protein